mmetsp:Transcript_39556/g.103124  ORF Transcript_39556/g.103124 Transcript_39556/m.103124 type:complete len:201 (-) Transcript_39556:271-873(-)
MVACKALGTPRSRATAGGAASGGTGTMHTIFRTRCPSLSGHGLHPVSLTSWHPCAARCLEVTQPCAATKASRTSSSPTPGKVSEMSGGQFGTAFRTGTFLMATRQLRWRRSVWANGRDTLLRRRRVRSRRRSRDASPGGVAELLALRRLSNVADLAMVGWAASTVVVDPASDCCLDFVSITFFVPAGLAAAPGEHPRGEG